MTSVPDLKTFADQWRSRTMRPFNLLEVIREAATAGVVLDDAAVGELIARQSRWEMGEFVRPAIIDQFIGDYSAADPPKAMLDPWAGTGQSLGGFVRRFRPHVAVGLERNHDLVEVAQLLYANLGIDWRLGDPALLLQEMDQRFDVVTANPPFGANRITVEMALSDGIVRVTDELGRIIVLLSALRLTSEGAGFFVTSPSFLWDRPQLGVVGQLRRFGLYIRAALALPPKSFAPVTGLGGALVLIERKPSENIFLGELTTDPSRRSTLVANLRAMREGREPQLGLLIEPTESLVLAKHVAERELQAMVRRSGLSPVPLKEILVALHLPRRRGDEAFEEDPAAVYLPTIGTSPAVTSQADFRVKPQNYAQLIVDTKKADPAFLAHFFDTPLGRRLRETVATGASIPHITKSSLEQATIYLPPREVQAAAVEANATLTDLATRVEQLRARLWSVPASAPAVAREARAIGRDNKLEDWLETLPFPLGSILWAYEAPRDPNRKIEALFHFFEATAQFTVTILLSGIQNHPDLRQQLAPEQEFVTRLSENRFATASFGDWTTLLSRIAKSLRRELSTGREQADILLNAFGNPVREFLDMLLDTRIVTALSRVAMLRNQWKGHGGAAGRKERVNLLATLTDQLAEFRSRVASNYEDVLIVDPGPNRHREGLYQYDARIVMGTRMPFKDSTVQTLAVMQDGYLHLLARDSRSPLTLLPLFRIMESDETGEEACYFYNSVKGTKVRWVSYHYAADSDLETPLDADIDRLLRLLGAADAGQEKEVANA